MAAWWAADEAGGPRAASLLSSTAVPAEPTSLRGARVLIVDDHGDSLDMFVQAVEFCGASALGARSAQEAAAHLAEVDVVVTDLAMPDRDGIWLLDQVRRLPRRVRVLAVTGVAAQHNARLAAAPFDRILLKPLDPFRLCDEIEAVLRE